MSKASSTKASRERAHQDIMTTGTIVAEGRSTAPHGPLGVLMLGALGVVYGDIGTSPLYTLKTALYLFGHGMTGFLVLGAVFLCGDAEAYGQAPAPARAPAAPPTQLDAGALRLCQSSALP